MREIVSVRFRSGGKAYSFDPAGLELKNGCAVIVETSRGLEYGIVSKTNHTVEDENIVEPLRKVERVATKEDIRMAEENRAKEGDALRICRKKISEHNLEMKCIDVEYSFDGSKILFYFTADGRIDFRDLVKDLASVFRTRIELRQVGVRDEAKLIGGLAICGQPFCCNRFLDEFQPVSIKMAKEQGLSLNPTKISGTCGRLMCCLKYEQEAYEDLIKTTPKVSAAVETPQGKGTVVDVNLLRGKVKVRMDDALDAAPKVFDKCDLCWEGCKRAETHTHKALPQEEIPKEILELEEKPAPEQEKAEVKKPDGNKKKHYHHRRRHNHNKNNKPKQQ